MNAFYLFLTDCFYYSQRRGCRCERLPLNDSKLLAEVMRFVSLRIQRLAACPRFGELWEACQGSFGQTDSRQREGNPTERW